MIKAIRDIPGVPAPVGPYSPATYCGNMLFCSGQIGLDPESGKLRAGLQAQLNQVLENIKAVLAAGDSSVENILMSTIFLTEIADGAFVNEVYEGFVDKSSPPARQTVAVKDLPLGALVEISVIAVRDSAS